MVGGLTRVLEVINNCVSWTYFLPIDTPPLCNLCHYWAGISPSRTKQTKIILSTCISRRKFWRNRCWDQIVWCRLWRIRSGRRIAFLSVSREKGKTHRKMINDDDCLAKSVDPLIYIYPWDWMLQMFLNKLIYVENACCVSNDDQIVLLRWPETLLVATMIFT